MTNKKTTPFPQAVHCRKIKCHTLKTFADSTKSPKRRKKK